MLKKLKTNNRGFTIIEVMIVLAVAALIILIVLLAVPALQRSSRNTTIKSDASSVAGAITSYETNNGGALPGFVQNATAGTPDGTVIVAKSAATDPDASTIAIQKTTAVWKMMPSTGSGPVAAGVGAAGSQDNLGPGMIEAWAGHDCQKNASNRAVSVWYTTELGGGKYQLQCVDAS